MPQITFPEMLLRVSLAFVAGFAVGWERESHGRPAGLRTNILACVAAALAMIISETLVGSAATGATDFLRADPARLAAGILAGMGFLGGGAIMRHENFVHGVTTAATLWTVTVLGLAMGAGFFALGFLGVAFAIFTLLILTSFEKRLKRDWYATLTIVTALDSLSEAEVRTRLESLGATVEALKLRYELQAKQRTVTCDLKLNRPERFEVMTKAVQDFSQLPGVVEIKWE